MTGRIYPSIRKALHYTVRDFCGRDSAKTLLLCEALNCKPSTLSAMTSEYEHENSRNPSPEDYEIIMRVTGDDSIARTAADLAGSETHPKRDHLPEQVERLARQFQEMGEQLSIMVKLADTAKPRPDSVSVKVRK